MQPFESKSTQTKKETRTDEMIWKVGKNLTVKVARKAWKVKIDTLNRLRPKSTAARQRFEEERKAD